MYDTNLVTGKGTALHQDVSLSRKKEVNQIYEKLRLNNWRGNCENIGSHQEAIINCN